MHSSCRIFPLSVVLCCAAGACSSSSAPADSASGGVSGGAPSSGASSVVSPGGGTGGAPGSTSVVSPGGGTGGAPGSTGSTATGGEGTTVTSGSSGGAITPGTGGSDLGAGTGGVTRGGPQSSGGSPVTGGGGATSAGGSAGKPDQNWLPALTVHLAGDSTMSTYAATTTQEGWGQELGQFFISKVTIDNQAQPGANIETFYSGRWKTLIGNVKAGDYVMAAFGINDSGTTHGPVAPAAFQTQMGVMADEVAAKKATFIPTTSSPLQVWVGGKETNARLQPYGDATIALGMSKGLLVDDLTTVGVAYYNMIGQTAAAALTFNGDNFFFNEAAATEMAMLASQELATIKSPLAAYLK